MIPRVLTIAGSDPGGGAGIQADLKTFTAFRVYGMSAVTAVTVQNTLGVGGFAVMSPALVAAQIRAVLGDIGADAVKIGMLGSPAVIRAAARELKKFRVKNLVLDPVMTAKSGHLLLPAAAARALVEELLPLALIVTPNAPEAEKLSGSPVTDASSAREAARLIRRLGPEFVLIKGGHLGGAVCRDIFYDGVRFVEFAARRIRTRNTHGTGCTTAAAIAAGLAAGLPPREAVREALAFVRGAIRNSFGLGKGHGPLNHFWRLGDRT